MRFPPLVPFLFVLTSVPFAQTVVVDDEPGPGVDFTNLQVAIDAVPSGATIVLAPGFHAGGFAIDGKALRIEGTGDAQVLGLGVVRNLAADQAVAISDLTVTHVERSLSSLAGTLHVLDCAGTVLVRDVRVDAVFRAQELDMVPSEEDSILVRNAGHVLFVRCELQGGEGLVQFDAMGGTGLLAVDSQVALAGCRVTGGTGAVGQGRPGGTGIDLRGGSLLLVGTTVSGGDGGSFLPIPFDGGNGGVGLRLTATALGDPFAVLRRTTVSGGAGGAATEPAVAGTTGLALEVLAGWIGEATPQTPGRPIR